MLVQSLGYSAFAPRTSDWSGYGTRLLGLQAVDRSHALAAHGYASSGSRQRRRRRGHRLRLGGGRRHRSTGWGRISTPRHRVAETCALAEERRVADSWWSAIPWATGSNSSMAPRRRPTVRPGRNFRSSAPARSGSAMVLHGADRGDDGVLPRHPAFRLSDYFLRPYELYFFHEPTPPQHRLCRHRQECSPPHDAGLVSFDDVGQGYDLVAGKAGSETQGKQPPCRDPAPLRRLRHLFYTWNLPGS